MKTYRILWANDTTPVIINSMVSLDHGNYKFTIVHSEENALEKLKTKTFDLVIANLASTQMNGLTILMEAKRHSHGITTIAQTEPGNMRGLIDALRSGVDDFLFIPFKIEEMLHKIFSSLNVMRQRPSVVDSDNMLTICCDCKKVKVANRHEFGIEKWLPIEVFLRENIKINPTSTYCPKCVDKVRHGMDLLTHEKENCRRERV